jgi:hypothetical protein
MIPLNPPANRRVPFTSNFCPGVAVPIPTLPLLSITKGVVSDVSSFTTKDFPEPRLESVKASAVPEAVLASRIISPVPD